MKNLVMVKVSSPSRAKILENLALADIGFVALDNKIPKGLKAYPKFTVVKSSNLPCCYDLIPSFVPELVVVERFSLPKSGYVSLISITNTDTYPRLITQKDERSSRGYYFRIIIPSDKFFDVSKKRYFKN